MAKLLRCRDAGQDCDWQVCGATEKEVMTQGAEHARDIHHRLDLSLRETERIRLVIQERRPLPGRRKTRSVDDL